MISLMNNGEEDFEDADFDDDDDDDDDHYDDHDDDDDDDGDDDDDDDDDDWRWLKMNFDYTLQKLPWNLKISPWKRRLLLETIIARFHVKLGECIQVLLRWFFLCGFCSARCLA